MTGPVNIVSIVDTGCNPDTRVMRMAEALTQIADTVTVVCRLEDGLPPDETVNGVRYLRVPMRSRDLPLKRRLIPRHGLMKFEAFRWFVEDAVMARNPTIIHANDLLALPAGVALSRKAGAKVVYDAHDVYLHQPKRRSALVRWHGSRAESRNIRRAEAVITVTESIVDFFQTTYGIPRPTIVMNSPDFGDQKNGPTLREEIGLADDVPLAVYLGRRDRNRGLDRLTTAMAQVPDLHVAMLGHSADGIDDRIAAMAERGGYKSRLHLCAPVPHDRLVGHIRSADFSVVPLHAASLNHEFALPNKLFESVFAGLPVVVSDLKEMGRFVRETDTGLVMDARSVESIVEHLQYAVCERDRLKLSPEKVQQLWAEYGWPVQSEKLLSVYRRLISEPGSPELPA